MHLYEQYQQLRQTQQNEFAQEVLMRRLNHSTISMPVLNYLDCSGKPDRLTTMIKSKFLSQTIQKLNISTCNVSNITRLFSNNSHYSPQSDIKLKTLSGVSPKNRSLEGKQENQQQYQNLQVEQRIIQQYNMHGLKQLILDNNFIKVIPVRLISGMKMLRKLSFNNNLVETLPYFSKNSFLVQVYARFNPIKKFLVNSQPFYLKQIDFQWIDYIDLSSMEKSRYCAANQEWLDCSPFRKNSPHQIQLSQVFAQIINQVKRQSKTSKIVASSTTKDDQIAVSFDRFFKTFLKIKGLAQKEKLGLISFNLRKAILHEFDYFIEYCHEIINDYNFNELRYKGNLFVQYALQNEYQCGLSLFMKKQEHFKENLWTMYQTLTLACKFSHYKLFKCIYEVIMKQNSKSTIAHDHLSQKQSSPLKIDSKMQMNSVIQFLFQPSSQLYPQIETSLQSNNTSRLQEEFKQEVVSTKTKFYCLVMEILLNFDTNKKSMKIVQLLISLLKLKYHQCRQENQKKQHSLNSYPKTQTKPHRSVTFTHYNNSSLSCYHKQDQHHQSFKCSIKQYEEGNKNESTNIHNQNYTSFQNEEQQIIIPIETPAQCSLRQLTKQQVQHLVDAIIWIKQSPKISKYFKILQDIPYTKERNLLEVAGSIKNNHLLLFLLSQGNFCPWNRNQAGRIARNSKVLVFNKKILYHHQIMSIQKREKQIENLRIKQFDKKEIKTYELMALQNSNKKVEISQFQQKNTYFQKRERKSFYWTSFWLSNRKLNKPKSNDENSESKIKFTQGHKRSNSAIMINLGQQHQSIHFKNKNKKLSVLRQSAVVSKQNSKQKVSTLVIQQETPKIMNDKGLAQRKYQEGFEKNQHLLDLKTLKSIKIECLDMVNRIQSDLINDNLKENSSQINDQFQLFNELGWINYLCDTQIYRSTKESSFHSSQISKSTILTNISRNILSCTCVELEQEEQNIYLISKEQKIFQRIPERNVVLGRKV